MEAFVDNMGEIKEKIEMELTLDNVMEYKNTVKSFLNFYVDNVLQYKDVMSRHPRYGYSQKMTIVKQAEMGLNELEDVMNLINTKRTFRNVKSNWRNPRFNCKFSLVKGKEAICIYNYMKSSLLFKSI